MKLYYTTIAGHLVDNKNPLKSLGGYRSSTIVPNGVMNSLFSDLSSFKIDSDKEEYIALCLFNDSNITRNVTIWFELGSEDNPCYSKIEMAAVTMPMHNNVPQMEFIRSVNERPYVGMFSEYNQNNKAFLGNLPAGVGVGLWLRRTIDKNIIEEDHKNSIYLIDESKNQFTEKKFFSKDVIVMKIDFEDVT